MCVYCRKPWACDAYTLMLSIDDIRLSRGDERNEAILKAVQTVDNLQRVDPE